MLSGELTLDYVIFLGEDGALCLMTFIRHGGVIEALEVAGGRSEHNEDIIQVNERRGRKRGCEEEGGRTGVVGVGEMEDPRWVMRI